MSIQITIKNAFRKNPGPGGAIIGAIFGFLLLYPYTALIYFLFDYLEAGEIYVDPRVFKFFQLATAALFLFFGGFTGLIYGKLYDRKRSHIMERIKREKNEAALETLKELTVTLSHYIINSSSIIRGFALRGVRGAGNENIKEYFSIIREEVDKTIAVIKGLETLKGIETTKYVESGTVMMIDLRKEIEEQLKTIQDIDGKDYRDEGI
ncbi:MAG: hypothetical protein M1510_10025 [Nitrospirae bacterium]|nr:hypothetical protein [Nitrospirota bacterium]MCL5236491.1 hypothetical protein [Nitrospirota bacterium]